MVAMGVSGLQTATAQDLTTSDPAKPWSVSATLRGFYDSNRDTIPDDAVLPDGYEMDSFGFEVSPALRLNWVKEQTAITAGYTYSYKWYDQESYWDDDNDSQSHQFNIGINHDFSPRYRIYAADNFFLGQEPDQLRGTGNSFDSVQYVPGNNIRNDGRVIFGADLTRIFGIELGYSNGFTDYEDDENFDSGVPVYDENGFPIAGLTQPISSLSALLDRIDQMFNLDGRWTLSPSTVGILGYGFSQTDYLRDEVLGYTTGEAGAGEPITSDDRNNRSHYFYVGADHAFTSDLSGNMRVGARYNDYYNDPNSDSEFSPYVRLSGKYNYLADGSVELGVSYDRTATDVFGVQGGDFVRDQEAFVVYGVIRQRIVPKLFGSLNAQFQNSNFNGGSYDGDTEQFYILGVNLEYRFDRHFSAHIGYNFDYLASDIPGREYDRNRVYLGVTATY